MAETHDMKDLETIINVEHDTSDLDFIIDHDWYSYSEEIGQGMEVISEIAQFYKDGIIQGIELGAEMLADTDRSLQELYLARNSNLASLNLISNIVYEEMGENNYIIGPDVGHFYPLCIEYGRGEVRPINYSVLHYYTLSGVEVFSKYSSATEPSPFMAPAFEETVNESERIMRNCIDYFIT